MKRDVLKYWSMVKAGRASEHAILELEGLLAWLPGKVKRSRVFKSWLHKRIMEEWEV